MATALVALEGVLKTETGDPIHDGIKLFRILAEHYRVVICSDMSPALTEHWLKSNLIVGYGDIYDDRYSYVGQGLRSRQLAVARSLGKVELFISAHAEHCSEALSLGIPTIMFASPVFVRSDRPVRKWGELSDEVDKQRLSLLASQEKANSKEVRWG